MMREALPKATCDKCGAALVITSGRRACCPVDMSHGRLLEATDALRRAIAWQHLPIAEEVSGIRARRQRETMTAVTCLGDGAVTCSSVVYRIVDVCGFWRRVALRMEVEGGVVCSDGARKIQLVRWDGIPDPMADPRSDPLDDPT